MTTLSTAEFLRFQRQISVPEIGYEGQKKLKNARVLLIGAGGLGATVALYLASSGVGLLGLIDHDRVDLSNLHRQILYRDSDIGRLKVECAQEHLLQHNPHCDITIVPDALNDENADTLIAPYDIIADCSDNFATRFLVNRSCVTQHKTLITAAIHQHHGQLAHFPAGTGRCYACIYESIDSTKIKNCATAGVLGTSVGCVGTLQAQQIVNYILNPSHESLFVSIDTRTLSLKKFKIPDNPNCTLCHPVMA